MFSASQVTQQVGRSQTEVERALDEHLSRAIAALELASQK